MILGVIGEAFGSVCLGALTNRLKGPLTDYERQLRAALRTGQPKNNHIPRTVLDCAASALMLTMEQEKRSFDVQASMIEQKAILGLQNRLLTWTKAWLKAEAAKHDNPELKLLSDGILSALAESRDELFKPDMAVRRRAAAVAAMRKALIEAIDPPESFLRAFDGESEGPGWFENFASLVADAIKHDAVFNAIFKASTLATMHDMLVASLLQMRELREETQRGRDERTQDRVMFAAINDGVRQIASELRPELELVRGYDALSSDQVRRLPTTLVVADHGVVPYLDDRALKANLIRWAHEPGEGPVAGRLYAAGAGFGKTRLCLDAVEDLNAAGWIAGFLPQAALDATGVSDGGDGRRRLERLFGTTGITGIMLVLDYAEARPDQIEQIVAIALRVAGDVPIRIVALARSAGGWWQALLDESREVARVFDRNPVLEIEHSISNADRETLFHTAHESFVEALRLAQSDTHALLPPDAGARPFPESRLSSVTVSPIEIIFEAYLAARGIATEDSALVEMAREEERHWRRALRLDGAFPHSDALPVGVLLAAAGLTLRQGDDFANTEALQRGVDELLEASLGIDFLTGASVVERARGYAAIRRTVVSLYADDRAAAPRLRPILPDLVGEHLVARALEHDPTLFRRMAARFPEKLREASRVIARATKSPHVPSTRALAEKAISSAFLDDLRPVIEAFLWVGRSELVPLDSIVGEILYLLPSETLANIPFIGINSIVQSRLNAICMRECQRRVAAGGSITMRNPDVLENAVTFPGVRDMSPEDSAIQDRALWAYNAAMFSNGDEARRLIDESEAGFHSLVGKFPHIRPLLTMARIAKLRRYGRVRDVAGFCAAFDAACEDLEALEREEHSWVGMLRLYLAEDHLTASRINDPDPKMITLLAERLLEMLRSEVEEPAGLGVRAASHLGEAAATLVRLGYPENARAYAGASAQILRLMLDDAVERPGDADLQLADALINQSLVLDYAGDTDASLQASLEAFELIRQLYEHYPDRFRHKYAKALDNLAVDYARREEFEVAFDYAKKSVFLFAEAGSMENRTGMEDAAAAATNAALVAWNMGIMLFVDVYLDIAKALYDDVVRNHSIAYPEMFENFQRMRAARLEQSSAL